MAATLSALPPLGEPPAEVREDGAPRGTLSSVEIIRRTAASTTAALVAWAVLIALLLLFDPHFGLVHKVDCRISEAQSDVPQRCWPGPSGD